MLNPCLATAPVLLISCMASPVNSATSDGPPGAPIELHPARRELFLDDFLIQEMAGLTRTMHQPARHGAVVEPDAPSDGSLIQIRSAPMWDPDARVYKLAYLAYTLEDHTKIGMAMAVSEDGIQWEKPDLGQQIEVRGSTNNNRIHVEPTPGRRPPDFTNVVCDSDDPDPARRFKGLLGATERVPIVSPDAVRWTRLDVPPIPSSDESSLTWDRPRGRFLALVKGGNADGSRRDPQTLSAAERADQAEGWGAVCLAVLRRDGFVSLDADGTGGHVLTRPLRAAGCGLWLNVDAAGGRVEVDVLDADGRALPGFTRAACRTLTRDGVGVAVDWRDEHAWAGLEGRTVRLKIHLTNARLYALWVA